MWYSSFKGIRWKYNQMCDISRKLIQNGIYCHINFMFDFCKFTNLNFIICNALQSWPKHYLEVFQSRLVPKYNYAIFVGWIAILRTVYNMILRDIPDLGSKFTQNLRNLGSFDKLILFIPSVLEIILVKKAKPLTLYDEILSWF